MKIITESPDLGKSVSKGRKTKGQLISNLLSDAMAHIKIKKEPVSEEESNPNTSFKLKSKGISPKQNGLDSRYLISKLVFEETKDMGKKKKRKSHNNSQDLISDAPALKKIKLEKISDDESALLKTKNKAKDNSSLDEKANKSSRDSLFPVEVKKESDNDILLSKERDMLEKLFSKSDNISTADSNKNKLKNRRSLPEPKQTNTIKRTFHNHSLPAHYLGDKNNLNSKNGSDNSAEEEQATLSKKSTLKIDRLSSNVLSKLTENNPIKSKISLKARHSSSSSSESEADLPLPKQIRKEISTTKPKEKDQKRAPINLKNKLLHDKPSDSSSDSDTSEETNNRSFEKKRNRLESYKPRNLKKTQGIIQDIHRGSDTDSSSEDESPKPQQIRTISKDPLPLQIKNTGKSVVPHTKLRLSEARTPTKPRATSSSSADSEGELVQSQKKNNKGTPTATRVPLPLQIKRNKKSSDSESEADFPLPIQAKKESMVKNKLVFNQAASGLSSELQPSKRRESFNKSKLVVAPVKSHKQRVEGGNKQNINSVRRNESTSESGSEEEMTVPQPQKIHSKSSKTPRATFAGKTKPPVATSRAIGKRNAAKATSSDSEDESVPSNEVQESPSERSSSESEMPAPKKVIMGNGPLGVASKRNKLVPVPIPMKQEDDRSRERSKELSWKKKSQYNTQNINSVRRTELTSESGSEEEVTVPRPQKIKSESSKTPRATVAGKTKPVASPREIGKRKGAKASSSDSEDESVPSNKVQDSPSEKSSSESEMPAPKKVKMENGPLSAAPKRNKLVPEPIHMKQEDDRSRERSKELLWKKKSQYNTHDSESESSSEEEVPVPQPRKVKYESSKSLKATVAGKTTLPVPPPRKFEKRHAAKDTSSHSEGESAPSNKARVSAQDSPSESSSESEMPAPKKAKMENDRLSATPKRNREVPMPLDMKQEDDRSDGSDEQTDSDENVATKADTRISKEKSQYNAQTINSVRRDDSESESSSEEEVPVPRPRNMKSESSKTPKVTVVGKTKLPIPSARKMEERHAANATSDSEDESVPSNKVQDSPSERSSFESEMPAPKKAKMENGRLSVTPKLNRHVPMPIDIKQEDDSPERSHEHSESRAELSWREKSQYNAMSWMEKLKYRFPGIEKQKVPLRLPQTNVRYSLLLVPKNIDPQSLVNLKCNLNKETVINLHNRECVFEPLPQKPDPVVVNLDGPRLVELQSVLSLHQSVPKLTVKELNVPERTNVSLPGAIKARHPIFGVNYKPKLSLGKKVKRKLQEAMEQKRKAEEKARRRGKVKKEKIFLFE